MGSMLEPRSRRGERFIVSGAPNAANASKTSRADSCSRLQRSGGPLRAATACGLLMPGNRESAEPWPYAAKASKE